MLAIFRSAEDNSGRGHRNATHGSGLAPSSEAIKEAERRFGWCANEGERYRLAQILMLVWQSEFVPISPRPIAPIDLPAVQAGNLLRRMRKYNIEHRNREVCELLLQRAGPTFSEIGRAHV